MMYVGDILQYFPKNNYLVVLALSFLKYVCKVIITKHLSWFNSPSNISN